MAQRLSQHLSCVRVSSSLQQISLGDPMSLDFSKIRHWMVPVSNVLCKILQGMCKVLCRFFGFSLSFVLLCSTTTRNFPFFILNKSYGMQHSIMLYAFHKGIQNFYKHEGIKSCTNMLEALNVLWQARNWSKLMWSEHQIVKGLL